MLYKLRLSAFQLPALKLVGNGAQNTASFPRLSRSSARQFTFQDMALKFNFQYEISRDADLSHKVNTPLPVSQVIPNAINILSATNIIWLEKTNKGFIFKLGLKIYLKILIAIFFFPLQNFERTTDF